MQWFKHDIGSYKSEQIQALRLVAGGAAVDAYYAMVEEIYENEGPLTLSENQAKTRSVLHGLCLGWSGFMELLAAIEECELLEVSKNVGEDGMQSVTVASRRAERELDEMNRLAEISRQNGKKGGRPKKGNPEKTQRVSAGNPAATQKKADYKTIRLIEKEVSKDTSKKNDPAVETAAEEIVAYLNARIGTRYKPKSKGTLKHVSARLREGYTVDDFKTVIDKKCADWRNDPRMAPYLRPETLFGPKFEGYLNEIEIRGGVADGRYDKYR